MCVCVYVYVMMTIDMEHCYYLVILLPRTRASFIDYFACEQRILARIHLRVHGLLRETLQAFNFCMRKREKETQIEYIKTCQRIIKNVLEWASCLIVISGLPPSLSHPTHLTLICTTISAHC